MVPLVPLTVILSLIVWPAWTPPTVSVALTPPPLIVI